MVWRQADRSRGTGWVPLDFFLASQLLLPAVLQAVWPPALSRGSGKAEEPVHHHAERGPSARERQ